MIKNLYHLSTGVTVIPHSLNKRNPSNLSSALKYFSQAALILILLFFCSFDVTPYSTFTVFQIKQSSVVKLLYNNNIF